jgi:hypothetical protein
MRKFLQIAILLSALSSGTLSQAEAAVVGSWSLARGGSSSVEFSPVLGDFRAIIQTVSPGATYSSADTLTPEFLAGVDVLMIGAAFNTDDLVAPLSPTEQTVLLNYVAAGGSVGIVVENSSMGSSPAEADAVFSSFLNPFGVHVTGQTADSSANVTNPSHPVTNGPYGSFSNFAINRTGYFDVLGPHAQTLAIGATSLQPLLLTIESGAIGPGSGRVWMIADGHQVVVPSIENATVLLENSIAYLLAVPEPGSFALAAVGLFGLAVASATRLRRRATRQTR